MNAFHTRQQARGLTVEETFQQSQMFDVENEIFFSLSNIFTDMPRKQRVVIIMPGARINNY
jgi:hypothetical protein